MSETDSDYDDDDIIEDSGLCGTCKYLRIRQLFTNPGDRELTHDLLNEILDRQASCALCRLIGHTIHQSACTSRNLPPPHPDSLASFQPKEMFPAMKSGFVYIRGHTSRWITKAEYTRGVNPADLLYVVRKGQLEGHAAAPVIRIVVELGVLEALTGEIRLLASDAERVKLSPAFHTQLIHRFVDFDMLKTMMACCSSHTKCQSSQTSVRSPTNIRVIDTVEHCVIPMNPTFRYVALSYTWGGDQQSKLLLENVLQWSLPGGLPPLANLPRTIHDAITVCQRLNHRYLWIDSLCIIQDDPTTLRGQLEQMDAIYQSAEFTIVAAGGVGANAGLPGISFPRREAMQLVASVQGLQLSVPMPSLSESAKHSFWKTRAWTYQEQMLSPKSLVFTEWQVYFQCPSEVCSEDRVPEAPRPEEAADTVQIDLDEVLGRFEQLAPLKQDAISSPLTEADQDTPFNSFALYQTAVASYASRDLGYQADILNAFIGVANALQAYAGFRGFVGGLSVIGLADALLWKPTSALKDGIKRRQSLNPVTGRLFPSWSWAGWVGTAVVDRAW